MHFSSDHITTYLSANYIASYISYFMHMQCSRHVTEKCYGQITSSSSWHTFLFRAKRGLVRLRLTLLTTRHQSPTRSIILQYQHYTHIQSKQAKEKMSFEPKTKVELDPPKDDIISLDYLSKCDGELDFDSYISTTAHVLTFYTQALTQTTRPMSPSRALSLM